MTQPPIIDAHLHIYRSKEEGLLEEGDYEIWEYGHKPAVEFGSDAGDIEDALAAINRSGIAKAVALNFFGISTVRKLALNELPKDMTELERESAVQEIEESLPSRLTDSNRWIGKLAETYPMIIPFITTDPDILDPETARLHIREMVKEYGARGVKWHPVVQEFHLREERLLPSIEATVDLEIPILVHSGPDRQGRGYGIPGAFSEALKRFPTLKMIVAHMGGGAWRELSEFASHFPNVIFDCSEIIHWVGGTNAPTPRQLARLIRTVGSNRVMMGSDYPAYEIDRTIDLVMALPMLGQEEKEAILGLNAVRFFGL